MVDHRFPSLDAIRAFAVSLVVLYHLKVPEFAFGYLGVDLFFMLSGFLMTHTMLTRRQKDGHFKVGSFFIRRFRRIVPSLLIVVFAALLASFLLMSPGQLTDTVMQSFYSQFFISNFLYFDQAGYFAPENEVRALLHTWSLSVEEQFYLFFMLLLALGNRINFSRICLIVSVLGLVGLGLSYWASLDLDDMSALSKKDWKLDAAIFFLPPFRLVQFMAGTLVAIFMFNRSAALPTWLYVAGFAALVIGLIILKFVPGATRFSAILVVFSFTLLLFGNPVLAKIGMLTPVKFVAQISYQLYLTHWPIIVIWRYWTFEQLNANQMVLLVGASIVSGWVLFRFTQYLTGLRFSLRKLVAICAVILIASLGLEAAGYYSNGAEWRIPEQRNFESPANLRKLESSYCGGTDMLDGIQLGSNAGQPLVTCTRKGKSDLSIYSLGDSHARHLVPGLSEVFPNHEIKAMYFASCLAQSGILNWVYDYEGRQKLAKACVERNQRMLAFFRNTSPTTIIIHQYSGYAGDISAEWFAAASFLIDQLQAAGHKVVWLGSVLRPNILQTDCYAVPYTYSDTRITRRCTGEPETIAAVFKKNNSLSKQFANVFVNVNSFFCSGKQPESCSAVRDGLPIFRDKHHLTVNASVALIKQFKNSIVPN